MLCLLAGNKHYRSAAYLSEESRCFSIHKAFSEAGIKPLLTKFAESGDTALHGLATGNLESAAKSYLNAGLEKDAEYANASKLLFDAYVLMDKAAKEEGETVRNDGEGP